MSDLLKCHKICSQEKACPE